jgi:hypothetical protein
VELRSSNKLSKCDLLLGKNDSRVRLTPISPGSIYFNVVHDVVRQDDSALAPGVAELLIIREALALVRRVPTTDSVVVEATKL